MKKILLPILALGGLLFASSCQMDEPDAGTLTGEVNFTITAGIPGSINTYASNDGGATNVARGNYDQRFILEVYDGENYTNLAYREVKTVEVGEKTSFNVRLLAKKYTFALWADFVTNESTKDNLYNTSEGLDAVKIKSNRPAGQEIADAYCYSEEVDLTEGSLSKTFTLRRPFGKIRLVSTDAAENYTDPELVTVTYGTDVMVPTGYNVLTGEASVENAKAGNYTFTPYTETVTVGGENKGTLYILGIDYIIASKSATSVSFDVKVDGYGTRSVTNIPVSANKLTTVIGNFYTNEGKIDVIVEDGFEESEIEIPAEEINADPSMDLAKVINNALPNSTINLAEGEYTCTNGITIDKPIRLIGENGSAIIKVPTTSVNTKYTIMLKGDDIAGTIIDGLTVHGPTATSNKDNSAIMLYNGGTEDAPVVIRNCKLLPPQSKPDDALVYNGIVTTYGDINYLQIEHNTIEDARYGMYFNSIRESNIVSNTINGTLYGGIVIYAGKSEDLYKCYNVNVNDNILQDISSDGKNDVYRYALTVPGIYGENLTQNNNDIIYAETAHEDIKKLNAYGFSVPSTENIQTLVKNLPDNGVLVLSEGEYTGDITIPAGKTVTLKGSADHGTTLKGQITTTGANVAVEGIVIENTAYGIYSDGGSSITATDCIFNVTPNESNNNTAVMTWASNGTHESVVLTNCTFNAEGVRTVQLRQVKSAVIEGCTFNDPYSYAVQLDEAWTNLTFKNNTVNNAMSAIYIHQGTTGSSVSQENNTLNNVQFPYAARPQALNEQSNSLEGFWYYVTSRADDENNMAKALASASTGDYICVTAGEYVLGQIQDKSVNFVGPNVGIPGTSNERKEEAILKVKVYQPKTRPNVKISFDGVKIIQSQSNTILFDVEGGADVTVKNSIVEVDSPASKGLLYANGTRIPANITFENNLLKCTGDENVSLWVYGNKSTSPSNVNVKILNNTLEGIYLNFGLGGNDATKSAMEISGNVFRNLDEGVAAVCLNASSVDNGGFIVKGNDFSAVTTACAYYSSYAEARCDQEDNINWITMNKY